MLVFSLMAAHAENLSAAPEGAVSRATKVTMLTAKRTFVATFSTHPMRSLTSA